MLLSVTTRQMEVAMMSRADKDRAQREALREAVSRPATLQESRSETLLRRYLAAALYAAGRRAARPRRNRRAGRASLTGSSSSAGREARSCGEAAQRLSFRRSIA
jgi:hypothetical protein